MDSSFASGCCVCSQSNCCFSVLNSERICSWLSENNTTQAKAQYKSAFELLPFLDGCENSSVNDYFENRSQNLSYEIASIGLAFNLSSTASICALEYYVAQFDAHDNLPQEWAYHKLALLYEKIKEKDQAIHYRSLALEINPTFNPE